VAERLLKVVSVDDGGTTRHTNVLDLKEECARFTLICADFVLRVYCGALSIEVPATAARTSADPWTASRFAFAVGAEDSALVV